MTPGYAACPHKCHLSHKFSRGMGSQQYRNLIKILSTPRPRLAMENDALKAISPRTFQANALLICQTNQSVGFDMPNHASCLTLLEDRG